MNAGAEPKVTRREFLYPVSAGVGAATAGLGLWAVLRAAAPVPSVPQTLLVDLAGLGAGAEMTVIFRGRPFLIRHRTPQAIAAAEAEDGAALNDPLARNANLGPDTPATDVNRRASPDGRFLVTSQLCTHLGCVVLGRGSGDFGGAFCPCHGAHFDTSGRTRKGPAPRNLPIPLLAFREGDILELYADHLPRADLVDLVFGV